MTLAQDVMTPGTECVSADETLVAAAQRMRDLDIGCLPICGADNKLAGMLTDRDIVVSCVADGGDPRSVRAGELAHGTPVTVQADADIEDVLQVMAEHRIRRVPVIEDHELVGIIAQADVARQLTAQSSGHVVADISRA